MLEEQPRGDHDPRLTSVPPLLAWRRGTGPGTFVEFGRKRNQPLNKWPDFRNDRLQTLLFLPQIRSGRTRGGDRRESVSEESGQWHGLHVIPERDCLTTDVFALRCNSSCTIATRDEGAALRRPRYDRRMPVGSSRSAVAQRHFAMATAAKLVDREYPWRACVG